MGGGQLRGRCVPDIGDDQGLVVGSVVEGGEVGGEAGEGGRRVRVRRKGGRGCCSSSILGFRSGLYRGFT